ncbi:MAG: hypothetical protein H6R05_1085 [Burkholderiaceae bacterium]|nr:hypothetical protein [Burkholderiaceae bacterium]
MAGVCELCLQSVNKFVRSHIIPRAFFQEFGKGKCLEQMHESDIRLTGGFRVGVYGQFLCNSCEIKFQTIDENAIRMILQTEHKILDSRDEYSKVYLVENANQEKDNLHKFALSILWRASVSGLPAYKNVKLGCYQNIIRQAILDGQFSNDLLCKTGLLFRKIKDSRGIDSVFEPYREIGKSGEFKRVFGDFHAHLFGFPYGRLIIKLGGGDVKSELLQPNNFLCTPWTSQLTSDVTNWIYLSSPCSGEEIIAFHEVLQNHEKSKEKRIN